MSLKVDLLDSPDTSSVKFDENGKLIQHLGLVHSYYTCFRPCATEESPYIGLEQFHGKSFVTINGHGGGGWTLNWGSITKAFELVDLTNLIKKGEKVAVIGSGIIGLSTAALLVESGVKPSNIRVYTESLDLTTTTSFGSGAIFSAMVKDKTRRNDFDEILLNTFKFWYKIKNSNENNGKSKFPWNKLAKHYELTDFYCGAEKEVGFIDSDPGISPVIKAGLLPAEEIVTMKFKTGKSHKMKKVKTYFFQTYDLLKDLFSELVDLGVVFVEKKITSPETQITENTIFNCTGAGCRNVVPHFIDKFFPLTGHMILLNTNHDNNSNKNKNFNYIVLSLYKPTKDSEAEYFIFMPKKGSGFDGVFGGSKIPNYYGGDEKLDQQNYASIIRRARDVYGESYKTPTPKF